MKKLIFIVVLLTGLFSGYGQVKIPDPPSPRQQMSWLIDDLPSQEVLERLWHIVRNPETAKDKDELAYAQKKVQLAKELILKLLSLIKTDTSIFDYPGLIAKGRLSYTGIPISKDTGAMGYKLFLGFKPGLEGIGEYTLVVFFTEQGMITKVRKEIYTL